MERRRPGKRNEASPELIAMMRRPAGDGVIPEYLAVDMPGYEPAIQPGSDPLSAMRGIAICVVLSVPLWCCVGAAVGFALDR
jgi:hypothetical protein